jgi:hypothetical protein
MYLTLRHLFKAALRELRRIDKGDRMMARRQFLKASVGGLLFAQGASVGVAPVANEHNGASQGYANLPSISSTPDGMPTLYVPQGGSIDLSAYFIDTSGDTHFTLASHSAPLPPGVTLGPDGMLSADAGAVAGTAVDAVIVVSSSGVRQGVADPR